MPEELTSSLSAVSHAKCSASAHLILTTSSGRAELALPTPVAAQALGKDDNSPGLPETEGFSGRLDSQ